MADETGRPMPGAQGPGTPDGPGAPDGPGGSDGPRDLLAAYALDAVDDLDRRAVERLLAADPDARRELDEHRAVVAAFTVDADPPAALRERVLGSLATVPQVAAPWGSEGAAGTTPPAGSGSGGGVRPRSTRRRRWAVVAAAAAAVVAVAVPTTLAVQARQEQVRLQTQADAVASMLADPAAEIVRGEMVGGGDASALVSGDRVLFSVTDLPRAGSAEDYQLWLVEGEEMVSAGVFDAHDGSAALLVEAAGSAGVAVTLEPAGGSPQPTSDPLVVLET
ncbi:anti-sigma factor domain-containing protein [Oerskovia jenensis]|uniref:Regulator of SigK n=1 Tax=Oerskovia jenensis TaxID=162169 RepID=A0ABS2LJ05_9CELL|nr:anti-sigma factor [Oerskovia jenensis]MBM7479864.1 anti-sigma-K factor RskA [Oerskovia jenensis]